MEADVTQRKSQLASNRKADWEKNSFLEKSKYILQFHNTSWYNLNKSYRSRYPLFPDFHMAASSMSIRLLQSNRCKLAKTYLKEDANDKFSISKLQQRISLTMRTTFFQGILFLRKTFLNSLIIIENWKLFGWFWESEFSFTKRPFSDVLQKENNSTTDFRILALPMYLYRLEGTILWKNMPWKFTAKAN